MAANDRLQKNAEAAHKDDEVNGDDEAYSSEIAEATPINENLFLDEDLDGLDDELNELEIESDDDDDGGNSEKK